MQTCKSGPKVAILHPKTRDEGWDPQKLVIPMIITMFCMHKTAGEVWEQWRRVVQVQKSLFCMKNPQMRSGTHRD